MKNQAGVRYVKFHDDRDNLSTHKMQVRRGYMQGRGTTFSGHREWPFLRVPPDH